MVAPLYAARVEDLQFAPTIGVTCPECQHKSEIAVEVIRTKLSKWEKVLDLPYTLRCANCGEKGRAIIDARRALGYDQLDRRST